jgi:hypothetical protein
MNVTVDSVLGLVVGVGYSRHDELATGNDIEPVFVLLVVHDELEVHRHSGILQIRILGGLMN